MNQRSASDEIGQQTANSWATRLAEVFILPAEQRIAWPFGLDEIIRGWIATAESSLRIEERNNLIEWLWRLFIYSPDQAASRPASRFIKTALHYPAKYLQQGLAALHLRLGMGNSLDLDNAVPGSRTLSAFTQFLLLIAGLIVLVVITTTPMSWQQQFWFGGGIFAFSMLIQKYNGKIATLVLVSFSIIASSRYFWWRVNNTLDLETPIEVFLGLGLFAAECYALLILLLGFLQSIWPLQRKPKPLPADSSTWPTVDIYIPTYNEPLSVVKPTVFAAKNLDWPKDKIRIFLLDDGRRDAFREFAESADVEYIIRPENNHAKAGNLNHAMKLTDGEFIAIFDCDHMPVRSFLQVNMGWFLTDPKCALVQTPHHFFSPDPLERNLGTFKRVPNEGRLFYGLIQDANDLWNATFFCGSCAIIRRKPLEEVGGIAVETVTEDAHTALKMHRLGYNSVYMNVVQAAGLATESLAGHIGQRIRWARGMAQIFAIDNPLKGKGLKLFQRLCYSNSMMHFLHGIPRLVFLTAPMAYMYFGLHVFNAEAIMIASFVLPHLGQAMIANSQMQSRFRHSYWAEVYESLLAWYIALPTTLALINPGLGEFNVTEKGGYIEKNYFDWKISRPFIVLMLISLGGFILGFVRLFWWNADETGTVIINMFWTTYNLVILGAALGVARETKQIRLTHRIDWHMPVTLYLDDGRSLACSSENFSLGGMKLNFDNASALNKGTEVKIGIPVGNTEEVFCSKVVMAAGNHLSVQFDELDSDREQALVRCTFSRADAWLNWDETAAVDKPLSSLAEIFTFGMKGYVIMGQLLKEQFMPGKTSPTDTKGKTI